MCGRYYVALEDEIIESRSISEEIQHRFEETPLYAAMKAGEIFPTDIVPMKTSQGATLMKWGLQRWDNKGIIINARSETADQKPTFQKPLLTSRCAVPANAFFEWRKQDKGKIKISLQDDPLFYMAGLYVTRPEDPCARFAILTTAAHEKMAEIHDRMPLILPQNLLQDYLQHTDIALDLLHHPPQPIFNYQTQ